MVFAHDSFQLKGTIADAKTLQPLEGVNIIGENQYSISSATGTFTINNVSKGTYCLTISHLGYTSQTICIEVGPNTEVLEVFLEESTTALQEVEVNGKSKKRINKESPVVSELVSKEFLANNRENSLMQTLSKIPGVSTINIGSGQSKPVIRGLGFNRVAVVQNGVKHEAQQWGNDHGLEIDQYGIENIKIVKGPASLVYGSDAIAGVVDIQSNPIPFKHSFSGDVNLLGESNNDLLGISAGVEGRSHNWFYRGRLTYRDYGDYKVPTDKINYENYIFDLHDNNLRNTAGKEANASFSLGYVSDNIKTETFFSNVNMELSPMWNFKRTDWVNYYTGIGVNFNPMNSFQDLPIVNGYTLDFGARIKPLQKYKNIQLLFEISPYMNQEFSGGNLRTLFGVAYNFNK
mgnify:CR=1 FL=1